ncbi:hypothetical protein JXA05_01785, partial [Candidatus Peregrinibacteria bacterium]|nr:hypothetical protein [Candidatus Peregrinibacteria bacterium]
MAKKLFIAVLVLFLLPFAALPVSGSNEDSGALGEESFMFDLSAVTHENLRSGTQQSWVRKGA